MAGKKPKKKSGDAAAEDKPKTAAPPAESNGDGAPSVSKAPEDPADPAAWHRQPVLAAGSGR